MGVGVFQVFPKTALSLSIPSRCTSPELGSLLVRGKKSDSCLQPGTDRVAMLESDGLKRQTGKPKTWSSHLAELLGWLLW